MGYLAAMQIPPHQRCEGRIASRHPSQNQINSDPAGQNIGIRLDSLITRTINDKEEMACLTQEGVLGIITDKLCDLISVAAANGL
jgi:hypothetical protein